MSFPLLNKVLSALCVTLFFLFILLAFTDIADAIVAIISIISGSLFYIFPNIIRFPLHERPWFQGRFVTMLLSLALGILIMLQIGLLFRTRESMQDCQSPQMENFSLVPESFATIGAIVDINIKIKPDDCFQSASLKLNGAVVEQLEKTEFIYKWDTSKYVAGNYDISLEVYFKGNNNSSMTSEWKRNYTLNRASSSVLSEPILVSPYNGELLAPGIDVTLTWQPVIGATEYLVEIWGGQYGNGDNHTLICPWQGGTSCHIGRMEPGNVLWRVKARGPAGNESPWSAEWNFTPQ